MLLKLVPENTAVDFVSMRLGAFIGSAIAVVAAIAAFFILGLNFGIDFRGGVTIVARDADPVAIEDVRAAVSDLGFGSPTVQEFGDPQTVKVAIAEQDAEDGAEADDQEAVQQAAAVAIQEALRATLGEDVEFESVEVVGPTVSGELVRAGATAVVIAVAMMLLYIWFRFEWRFSVGAITALVHDVVLTLGVFAVFQIEFGLSIIAAILTIVGYSMNDTVVVFDRIRENLRKYKTKSLGDVVNLSINQTLARTFMTSVTTLLALVPLYLFGGEVLRGFTFAMIWGVIVGTYSSVFVAAPVLIAADPRGAFEPRKPEPAEAGTPA
ncbi:MAG: protein translocase subunit SecF [Pseudomonadota bacterium]